MLVEQNSLNDDLERFVFDNPELERLEAILDDFNPFVAMGWTRQEIRHSSCLRWLLDPRETHGLGAYVLRAFLKRIARSSPSKHAPTVIDVDSWDYGAAEVFQEWQGIDILIADQENRFVAVIENKIDSTEHSRQLQKYRKIIERSFPDHRRLYAYLTIDSTMPSDQAYVPLGYGEVAEILSYTLERRGEQLATEVRIFLGHYLEMLRRHILEDSEIQVICRQIYEKHKRALEVLFEYRPDRTSIVSAFLQSLIQSRAELVADHCTKSYVRFIPADLDFLPKSGEGWTRSGRILLFEFDISSEYLQFKILLGPGDQHLRERVNAYVARFDQIFNRANQKLYPMYWSFHSERWITKKQFADAGVDDLQNDIKGRFDRFIDDELPKIVEALSGLKEVAAGFQPDE